MCTVVDDQNVVASCQYNASQVIVLTAIIIIGARMYYYYKLFNYVLGTPSFELTVECTCTI